MSKILTPEWKRERAEEFIQYHLCPAFQDEWTNDTKMGRLEMVYAFHEEVGMEWVSEAIGEIYEEVERLLNVEEEEELQLFHYRVRVAPLPKGRESLDERLFFPHCNDEWIIAYNLCDAIESYVERWEAKTKGDVIETDETYRDCAEVVADVVMERRWGSGARDLVLVEVHEFGEVVDLEVTNA